MRTGTTSESKSSNTPERRQAMAYALNVVEHGMNKFGTVSAAANRRHELWIDQAIQAWHEEEINNKNENQSEEATSTMVNFAWISTAAVVIRTLMR